MNLKFAVLATSLSLASAKRAKTSLDVSGTSIKADSKLGNNLLSKARKLNDNEEIDFTWVSGYSIKFQGCHHINQWNAEADGDDEPKIQTKRLVRFRLCPSDSCTTQDAGGCDSGYGDYIIDLSIFMAMYWENKQEWEEWNCEYYENNVCDCENADNEEYCLYDCQVTEYGLDYCWDENPYQQDDQDEEEQFEVEEFLECAQWDLPEERRRKLENRRKLEDEVAYYIGPYCSDQGGKVNLGVFTDEFCTNFADDEDTGYSHLDFYEKSTGKELPYSSESLVNEKCISCMELADNNGDDDGNNNDQEDEDAVIEMCEELYDQAGKCESGLDDVQYPNTNACTYMQGIQIMRQDGIITTGFSAGSKGVAAFIGVFAATSVLLGAYVYYLKTKLDRAKIDLSE